MFSGIKNFFRGLKQYHTAGIAGCRKPPPPIVKIDKVSTIFNRNNIIPDSAFLYTPADFDTQKFLKKWGSVLAKKRFDGLWSADIIDSVRDYVSARLIITKLEKEHRLIRASAYEISQNENAFVLSMGVGCGDDLVWKNAPIGFKAQVMRGAGNMRSHYDTWADQYIGRDISKQFIRYGKVGDGVVIPENKATAVLYRYTPWIGERDQICGGVKYKAPFGNYYFWVLWNIFFGKK